MGVTNKFEVANDILKERLGYHLDPSSSHNFRGLLEHAGLKRFEHAVRLIELRPGQRTGGQKHHELVQTIWALMPRKTTKYRSPLRQHMYEEQMALYEQMKFQIEKPDRYEIEAV